MKVKIVFTNIQVDYDDRSYNVISEGISDWEEISQEDYNDLLTYEREIFKDNNVVILVQDNVPVVERIKDIKLFIKKNKEKLEEQKKKYDLLAKERAKKIKKKKEKRELKKLKALQEKYGNKC